MKNTTSLIRLISRTFQWFGSKLYGFMIANAFSFGSEEQVVKSKNFNQLPPKIIRIRAVDTNKQSDGDTCFSFSLNRNPAMGFI